MSVSLHSGNTVSGNGHHAKPGMAKTAAPELPHVTNNIVPLSTILRFHTQDAYKQLRRQIESLAATRTAEPDAVRKRKMLAQIVSLRQDFVKLYTLVKWAQRSKDVSRLIDLLNWLRTQEFYFDNLALGLNELNHFSGAKLPQADLLTAMEVLVKGRPQLSSYHHLPTPPVSPQRVLQVLQDLNLALTARMALMDDAELPPQMRRNYTVKDGRVTFTLPHEFSVSVTVGNDIMVESRDEYYKSPFFFIDFAFLCGMGADNSSLVTYPSMAEGATILPAASREKLESTVNSALLTNSLTGLYAVVHRYAAAFKLYLLARQVRSLALHTKWRGNVQYKHSTFLVVANYWATHWSSRNWRSFIEIGVDASHNLTFRWFKNGKYQRHGISITGNNNASSTTNTATTTTTSSTSHELSLDFVLSLVVNKHAEKLMRKVYKTYIATVQGSASAESVSVLSAHSLLVQLTPGKSTVFAINPLTGHFYFMDPSPLEIAAQHRINSKPAITAKPSDFVSEGAMVRHVVAQLVHLRTDAMRKATKTRLVTMGWVASDSVQLADTEITKLRGKSETMALKTAFFRARAWPASWFLLAVHCGASAVTEWWVARLKSVKGEWTVQWSKQVELCAGTAESGHGFFKALARASSSAIIHHLIVEDLQSRGIGFVKLEDESLLSRFSLVHPQTNSASRTVLALHNPGTLLPIQTSASTLFLACSFASADSPNELLISAFGPLHDISDSDAAALQKVGVEVDSQQTQFTVNTTVNLSHTLSENTRSSMLKSAFEKLAKINSLLTILHQVRATDLTITSTNIDELIFTVDPYYRPFVLKVHSGDPSAFVLAASEDEKHAVRLLVQLLNLELARSKTALVGAFKYLKDAVNIFKVIDSVQNTVAQTHGFVLQNNLRRLHFEPKFIGLNFVQFVFCVNSTLPQSPKKIQRDKITFNISFKNDRFAKSSRLLLKFSMKDNFNSQNMKFKKLFESVFAAAGDVQKEALARKVPFMKLYYDFVIDSSLLQPFMDRISASFIEFLKAPQQA